MSMDELLSKLKNDSLTPDDLKLLRSHLNSSSDDELSKYFTEHNDSPTDIDSDTLRRIKMKIDLHIDNEQYNDKRLRRYRIALAAASILLPIFIIATTYLFLSNQDTIGKSAATCAVTTGAGEISTVALPDGSTVILNGNSRLEFCTDFNSMKKRQVTFSGEAYFDISKEAGRPFEILTSEMTVKVLGTKFNITARDTTQPSSVTLESGRVSLTATASQTSVTLSPGERAILNPDRATFTIDTTDINSVSHWMTRELVFDNASPEIIVAVIETHYGIKLNAEMTRHITENFSGTLPGDNLSEAIETLSYVYGFDPVTHKIQ